MPHRPSLLLALPTWAARMASSPACSRLLICTLPSGVSSVCKTLRKSACSCCESMLTPYDSNNTRCITQTLYAIQNATGTELSVDSLTSVLTGSNTTLLNQIGNLNSSVLCTDCNQAMYAEVKSKNATVAEGTIGKAINSKCGANFTCESQTSPLRDRS